MLISYNPVKPGGDGIFSTLVRLWWMFIHNYHTYRWLLAQSVASRRAFLPRNEKRKGETAVITGGSRGIGAAVVRRLLQCDMHVIIGCRDRTATNNMIRSLRRKGVTTGTAQAIDLDLSSINSIKEFVFKVMKKDIKITVLINNAGLKSIPYGLTVEGLEQHFQVNYLGHVLLTYMLLPKLNCAAQPDKFGRVVNVSSLEHYGAYPDLEDSQMTTFYSPEKAYMDAKLMLTAWNEFLDSKLQNVGAFIRSYAVHPGFVKTEKWTNNGGWIEKLGFLQRVFFERKEAAADTIAYTALSPHLEGMGGIFLSNNDSMEPHPLCKDEKFQIKLWKLSCKILNLEDNDLAPLSEFPEDEEEEEEEEEEEHLLEEENKNLDPHNDLDLDFLEEFHTSCGFRYIGEEYFPYGAKQEYAKREDETLIDLSQSGSFFTTWKTCLKINLNFSVFKYLSFSSNSSSLMEGQEKKGGEIKPYYEYLINSVFAYWNLSNNSWFRHLETLSIFLLRRLDKFNSQFKLIQAFVRSGD